MGVARGAIEERRKGGEGPGGRPDTAAEDGGPGRVAGGDLVLMGPPVALGPPPKPARTRSSWPLRAEVHGAAAAAGVPPVQSTWIGSCTQLSRT